METWIISDWIWFVAGVLNILIGISGLFDDSDFYKFMFHVSIGSIILLRLWGI